MKKMIGMFLMASALFAADPTHHDTYHWNKNKFLVLDHDMDENEPAIETLATILLRDTIMEKEEIEPMHMFPRTYAQTISYAQRVYGCATSTTTCNFTWVYTPDTKKMFVFTENDYRTAFVLYNEWLRQINTDDDLLHRVEEMHSDWISDDKVPDLSNLNEWLCTSCRIRYK